MSFRSALASPSTSSGQVGQVTSATQAATVLITSATDTLLAGVLLPKGVYSITQNIKLDVPLGTTFVSYASFIRVLESDGVTFVNYNRAEKSGGGGVTSVAISAQESVTFTFPVTTDGVTIQSFVGATYTAGAGGAVESLVPDSGTGSLWCVKIA